LCVSSLDQICQGFGSGEGKVCTFRDCLGMFLAIDPSGVIYPCQRFCGQDRYRLGVLHDRPTLTELFSSPTALRMKTRQEEIRQACDGCTHLEYCRGGCPYNAWASRYGSRLRDPFCEAYREVFDYIQRRVSEEMACEENINAVAERAWDGKGHPLFRRGPLIELVREGQHPSHVARTAKRIIAAVELAKGPDIPSVGARLVEVGLCRTQQSAEASLNNLWRHLHPERVRLNNLYVHVTFTCQLRCTHCYACADASNALPTSRENEDARQGAGAPIVMSVAAMEKLIREAKECGFRQVIITGGEPLTHPHRGTMLSVLAEQRHLLAANGSGKMSLVLRTNFAVPLNADDLRRIAAGFDQVVASVDGNEQTHDARRGQGTYAATVYNLEAYSAQISARESRIRNPGELSLACVMRAADIQGDAGGAVRDLARRLGVRRTRFRPLLPLGRAADWDEPPQSEALGAHADPMELIENGFHPVANCGLGQNLYVEPSGESFPCYAYHGAHAALGNVIENGLPRPSEPVSDGRVQPTALGGRSFEARRSRIARAEAAPPSATPALCASSALCVGGGGLESDWCRAARSGAQARARDSAPQRSASGAFHVIGSSSAAS